MVIGSGTMGRGIVQLLAQTRSIKEIVWKTEAGAHAQNGLSYIKDRWGQSVVKGKYSADEVSEFFKKVAVTEIYQDSEFSDIIIEVTPEDLGIKKLVLQQVSEFCPTEALIASNTSSLSITEMSQVVNNPSRFIGIHFFNPAPVMTLVEIVSGLLTDQKTKERAEGFVKDLGKYPVFVNEAPGFVVNRMLIPMINEAIGILSEGISSAEGIDKAMCLGANHPIGPLALADLIGNDVCLSIMEVLHSETGDPKYRAHPLLRKMVRGNLLGKKTKKGFFIY